MFFATAVAAFFVNIILLIFANIALTGEGAFELAVLSLINMMLLSFVLLREPNQKTE
jgi:hypothetical protein